MQHLAAGGRAVAAARVFDLGASYLFYLVLAHALSRDDFGRLIVAMTVAQTAAVATRLGLETAVMRRVAEAGAAGERRIGGVLARAGAVAGVISVVAVIVIAAAIRIVPAFAHYRAALAGSNALLLVAIPIMAIAPTFAGALRGRGEVGRASIADSVVQPSVALLLACAALWSGAGVFASAALLASTFVALLLTFVWLQRADAIRSGASADGIVALGLRVVAFSSLNALAGSLDVLVLARFAEPATVALYAAALKMARALLLVNDANLIAFAPAVPHLVRDAGAEHLGIAYRTIVRWNSLLTAPAALLFIAIPERLLSLFGHDFVAAAPLLRILAITFAVFAFAGPVKSLLVMTGHERFLATNAALNVAVTFVLLVLLVPKYGASGAAVSLLFATIVQRMLLVMKVRSAAAIEPVGRRNALLFVAFACAVAAWTLLPVGTLAAAGCAMLIFGALAALSRFDAYDRDVVRGIFTLVKRA